MGSLVAPVPLLPFSGQSPAPLGSLSDRFQSLVFRKALERKNPEYELSWASHFDGSEPQFAHLYNGAITIGLTGPGGDS